MAKDNKEADFQGAVDHAVHALAPFFERGNLKSPKNSSAELFWETSLQVSSGHDDHGQFYILRESDEDHLFKFAFKERGAFDLYRKIVASRVSRGEELSFITRCFIYMILIEKISLREPVGWETKRSSLNIYIFRITEQIAVEFNLPKVGNAAGPKNSACDAMSSALEKLGHFKSSRAIQEILYHKSYKSLRRQSTFVDVMRKTHPRDDPKGFVDDLLRKGFLPPEVIEVLLKAL